MEGSEGIKTDNTAYPALARVWQCKGCDVKAKSESKNYFTWSLYQGAVQDDIELELTHFLIASYSFRGLVLISFRSIITCHTPDRLKLAWSGLLKWVKSNVWRDKREKEEDFILGSRILGSRILGSRIPDISDGKSGHFSWKDMNGLIFYQILKKNVLNPSI